MKKVFLVLFLALFSFGMSAQEPLYLIFEMMTVDEGDDSDYWKTENFWEKLHQERVKNGDIIGWDLWALTPSGTDQGHQYMTVTLFNDPVKMMQGGDFNKAMEGAYGDMSQADRDNMMEHTAGSRDLAVRVYLTEIATTGNDYEMPLGTIASINFMKARPGEYEAYEEMEAQVFKSIHQQRINQGSMESWGLLRNMVGYGTEAYASHITVDMYKDWDQFFNGSNNTQMTPAQQKAYDNISEKRDLRSLVFGTLVKKVR